MTIKLGIVMDPIGAINYQKDTSLALLLAAKKKGWQLFYMEPRDLFQDQGQAMGAMSSLGVFPDSDNWYAMKEKKAQPLEALDVILMRKDPPFNNEYIYSTYLLEQAEKAGTLIVNRPQSLRDFNEKFFATLFPDCIASAIVSCDMDRLKTFAKEQGDVIFKPMDGMGGASIFRVRASDPNISVILETLTVFGTRTIMGQAFIPEITQGDKRILMIDGEPFPYALARIPAKNETRGNLAAGGTGVGKPLSERDYWIASQVSPVLKEKGIIFAGLDVIGDYLTEINITSPTCVRELERQYGIDISSQIIACVEKHISKQSRER